MAILVCITLKSLGDVGDALAHQLRFAEAEIFIPSALSYAAANAISHAGKYDVGSGLRRWRVANRSSTIQNQALATGVAVPVKALLFVFVAVAGALTSVESGTNAKLTSTLGGPWWAAILFSLISIVLLGLGTLVLGGPFPTAHIREVPWWGWIGGVFGATYVMSMLIAAGQLGSGLFTGLTVTSAVVTSIALDHYGLIGFAQHTAGIGRLVGAALMIAGIVCVAVF